MATRQAPVATRQSRRAAPVEEPVRMTRAQRRAAEAAAAAAPAKKRKVAAPAPELTRAELRAQRRADAEAAAAAAAAPARKSRKTAPVEEPVRMTRAQRRAAEAAAAAAPAKKRKVAAPVDATPVTLNLSVTLSATGTVESNGAFYTVDGMIIPRTLVVAIVGNTVYYRATVSLGNLAEVVDVKGQVCYVNDQGEKIVVFDTQALSLTPGVLADVGEPAPKSRSKKKGAEEEFDEEDLDDEDFAEDLDDEDEAGDDDEFDEAGDDEDLEDDGDDEEGGDDEEEFDFED